MIRSIRRNAHAESFAWPYFSSAAVIACALLVYYVAARRFGIDGFAEFSLARRSVSFLQPLILQGFALALTHFVAHAGATPSGQRRLSSYFYATLGLVLLIHVLAFCAAFLFPALLAQVFFGDGQYSNLVAPAALLLFGLSIHGLSYAYWRGKMRTGVASLIEAVNMGMLPLVAIAVFGHSVTMLLWSTAVLLSVSGSSAVVWIVVREPIEVKAFRAHLNDIMSYAIPRIPGAFALGGMLALPATITAHVAGIEAAGIVAFSCTLLTCAGSLVSPIGIALMPYATRRVTTGDVASLRQVTTHVVVATAVFGGLLMLVVEIFAGWGARWFLGVPDAGFSSVLRIVALGIIPFTIFVSCRAIVDGASVRAINARNASISLVTFGLLAAATTGSGAGLTPLLVSWVASLCLLAVLTLRDVYRLLGSTPPPAQAIKPRAFLGLEKLRTFTQPESEVK